MDDKGRLVSTATSELDNVSIGPKNEVHFSRLVTTAQALGAGAENSKDGRADIRIDNFYILDNPVELTRAGLRLANAGPSEQEAYDGAKVLLKKLKDRGIILKLPNFDLQVTEDPDHVTVDVPALSVDLRAVRGFRAGGGPERPGPAGSLHRRGRPPSTPTGTSTSAGQEREPRHRHTTAPAGAP